MTPHNDTPWWDQPKEEEIPWWDQPTQSATRPTQSLFVDAPSDEAPPEDVPQAASQTNHPSAWQYFLRWVGQNIHTVIYTGIGLGFAIGILNIGFWRTFLIALCLGTGYVLGSWHDGNPNLIRRLKSFSRRFIDNNPFMK